MAARHPASTILGGIGEDDEGRCCIRCEVPGLLSAGEQLGSPYGRLRPVQWCRSGDAVGLMGHVNWGQVLFLDIPWATDT